MPETVHIYVRQRANRDEVKHTYVMTVKMNLVPHRSESVGLTSHFKTIPTRLEDRFSRPTIQRLLKEPLYVDHVHTEYDAETNQEEIHLTVSLYTSGLTFGC